MSNSIKVLSVDECSKEITQLRGDASALQTRIHVVAFSTLSHIKATGDVRGALALVLALPSGQRVEGLKAWYEGLSNGKLKFGKDPVTKQTTLKIAKDRSEADFDMVTAEKVTFGDYTKEARPRTFTVEQLIKQLTAKAQNTETNDDGTPKVDPAARAVAAKMVASYHAAVAATLQ